MVTTVSVGELRQNPKPALDAVQDGATVVVTKHGRPIADLSPHRPSSGPTMSEVAAALGGVGDPRWRHDLDAMRSEPGRDPWAQGA